MYRLLVIAFFVLLTAANTCRADEAGADHAAAEKPHDDKAGKDDKEKDGVLALLPPDSVTQHTVQAGGRSLAYTATAGTLTLRDGDGKRTALVFYVAYTLANTPPGGRPVSFFFNGGPGAASAYLHLGAAGPMALDFPAGNEADGAGARLKDNPDTWLPFTDEVFIDAVGSGWSRPAKPDEAQKAFWGVKQDAKTFAKVIDLWLAKNGRAASPKYLVGESYGGIRSVKVARELQDGHGIILDGIVMVSPAITMAFVGGGEDPVTDALRLPSFVAGRLERQHQFALPPVEDAYKFALGEYMTTEMGTPPQGDAAKSFYGKIAALTGVPEPVVAAQRGRLDPESHDVRSVDGRLMSVYEASLTVPDPFPEGGQPETDPVLDGYSRAYGAAMSAYAATQLNFKTDLTYTLLSMDVNQKWDFRSDGDDPATGVGDLRRLLGLDPSLKVFVGGGYFDLVVPFSVNRWIIEHIPVGGERIEQKTYPGGHMFYTRAASRAALRADVAPLYPAAR